MASFKKGCKSNSLLFMRYYGFFFNNLSINDFAFSVVVYGYDSF